MANIPFHIWQGLEVLHKTKVKVKQIACGAYHCLFLATTGRAYSCGLNKFGQLGRAVGSGSNAIVNIGVIPQLSDIAHIYCGSHHNFFVKSTGEIFSCGNNEFNQLNRIVVSGSETSINLGQNSSIPGLVKIACGHWHTLFLNSDGEALSCGYNNFGQLGRAAPNGSLAEVFLSNIVDIACGGHHSFLLTLDGQVYSCGTNSSGQTGRTGSGTATSVNLAIINSLSDIVKISASFSHSLFLNSAGEVYACGYNAYGELGRIVDSGDYNTVNLGLIEGLTGIVDIVAASMYSLFLKSNGIVYSCGTNRKGQLGRIAEQGYIEGINLGPIEGLSDIESVHGSTSSLFLASEGRVLSCGENLWGQIGRVIDSGSNDTVNLGETRIAA